VAIGVKIKIKIVKKLISENDAWRPVLGLVGLKYY
jgi:hypothetical protein